MDIAYVSDANYIYQMAASMNSLMGSNESMELFFHVFSFGIPEEEKEKLEKLVAAHGKSIRFIDAEDVVERLQKLGVKPDQNVLSYAAYIKLVIPDYFTQETEYLLYIDCDTLICGGLQELQDLCSSGRMKEYPAAMAVDALRPQYKVNEVAMPKDRLYYNDGIILYNIGAWKKANITETIFYNITKVRTNYALGDQDILNIALMDRIYKLDMKYNFLSAYFLMPYPWFCRVYRLKEALFYTKEEYNSAKENAVIYHFSGGTLSRPWFRNSRHPMKKKYDEYAGTTPWGDRLQKDCKMYLPYRLQLETYWHFPVFVQVLLMELMLDVYYFQNYRHRKDKSGKRMDR